MTRIAVSSLVAAAVAAIAFLVPAQGATGRLTGEVGPSFKIEVSKGGNDVKTLKAGTYKIHIEDKATIHNFHLIGPGVNKKTPVAGSVTQTWTVKLKKGTYTYMCDVHASTGMKGKFTVK